MDEQTITATLVELHQADRRLCGCDDADRVTPDTCPLTDLPGFDSLLIPDLVRKLARALGQPFPPGYRLRVNVYLSADGRRKLNIREVARRYREAYVPQGSKV